MRTPTSNLLRLLLSTLAGAILTSCQGKQAPSEVLVFAAASTAEVLTEIGRDFEARNGAKVRLSFGSTGDLARQVRAGAPADVFVSADADTVNALVTDGFVRPADRQRIAGNRLVVIVPKGSDLRVERAGDLKNAAHVAIGDPEVVPAGKYAKKWLESAGAWTEVRERVVPTLDVRAALAAVESGRAEAGVVYATDAASSPGVRVVFEAKEGAPEIAYVRALLTRSKLPVAALFAEFLSGNEARATFLRHRFIL